MCGEKLPKPKPLPPLVGSPPHVRGKVNFTAPSLDLPGITPACAGKSVCCRCLTCVPRDHPRMCGEKLYWIFRPWRMLGSPPHVRGKEILLTSMTHNNGITPACAGKRVRRGVKRIAGRDHPRMCGEKRRLPEKRQHVKDHPRMCGEKMTPQVYHIWGIGSPPHVRGKVVWLFANVCLVGITPACAGKSLISGVASSYM